MFMTLPELKSYKSKKDLTFFTVFKVTTTAFIISYYNAACSMFIIYYLSTQLSLFMLGSKTMLSCPWALIRIMRTGDGHRIDGPAQYISNIFPHHCAPHTHTHTLKHTHTIALRFSKGLNFKRVANF